MGWELYVNKAVTLIILAILIIMLIRRRSVAAK